MFSFQFVLQYKKINMEEECSIIERLNQEIRVLDRRLDKSCEWVERNRSETHPSISFIQAVELYGLGFDVTQIKPK